MDDLGEILVGIILAVIVVVALIYVVLPIALCYYLGKQFYTQLKKYQLVEKTKKVLAIIGGASILIATAIITDSKIHGLLIAPLSALLFLIIAVPTLALWAYTKKRKFLNLKYSSEKRKKSMEAKIKENAWDIEKLTRKNQAIDNKYGSMKKEQEKIDGYLRELCSIDPRTYTILKREWQGEYKKLDDAEIERRKQELATTLKNNRNGQLYRKTEYSIKLCLTKIEELQRTLGKPNNSYDTNKRRIETFQQEKTSLDQDVLRVTNEFNENERAYQAFLTSKIVLD